MANKQANFFVGMIAKLFSKDPKPKKEKDLEFNSSTQKMGLSFTEKIRNTFRHKWINRK